MRTTVNIADALLARAKRHAQKTHRTVRSLIEEGLRRVLEEAATNVRYQLPDRSVGHTQAPDPLAGRSWSELRDEIYGNR
jgi:hypothetical protein